MRISWLEPAVISAARDAYARTGSWLEVPPAPEGVLSEDWRHVVEHVARAERVSEVIREKGYLDASVEFADSSHAIELATLAAAAHHVDALDFAGVEAVLSCEIDELVVYGTFLALLTDLAGRAEHERMLRAYERFSAAAVEVESSAAMWADRVDGIRNGLANVYVICGQPDRAHELYLERHGEATSDLVVALAASRAFLSARAVARAVQWLLIGADRANELGRPEMEEKLRKKATSLRRRMS